MLLLKISFILGYVILGLYIGYVIYKDRKIPQSISATVYSLEDKNKWLFTTIMFITAILIAPQLFEILSSTNYTILSFLASFGIMCVGADQLVKEKKNIIHYLGAVIMGIATQLIVWLTIPSMFLLWISYVVYTMYMDNGYWNMFFAEMVMMTMLFVCGIA